MDATFEQVHLAGTRDRSPIPGRTTFGTLLLSTLYNLRNTLWGQAKHIPQAAEAFPPRIPHPNLSVTLILRGCLVSKRSIHHLLPNIHEPHPVDDPLHQMLQCPSP